MAREAEQPKPLLGEAVEDAVGFGAAELRLTRDLFRRPRAVMDAYDAAGPTAGGLYPKPLRYYLAINGLYVLLMTVLGFFDQPEMFPVEDYDSLARAAGKSLEETRSDLEQWFSLLMIPVCTLIMAGPLYLLIRRWSPADNRTDFSQTFTFLNAWIVYTLPAGLVILAAPQLVWWLTGASFLAIPGVYALFGRGRWWRTRGGAWIKGVALVGSMLLLYSAGALVTSVLVMLAVVHLP